jgi:hypothetical protein
MITFYVSTLKLPPVIDVTGDPGQWWAESLSTPPQSPFNQASSN